MHKILKYNFGIKLYMFRTVPLSIIRSFSLYKQQWYMSYRFADSLLASKFKFKKLVYLGGFIIRIYHDARSPERKKKKISDLSSLPILFYCCLCFIRSLFLSFFCFLDSL